MGKPEHNVKVSVLMRARFCPRHLVSVEYAALMSMLKHCFCFLEDQGTHTCFVLFYMRFKAVNIIFVQKDKESCRLRHAPALVGGYHLFRFPSSREKPNVLYTHRVTCKLLQ